MSQKQLLVAGYYDESNLGDESYREIMMQFFPDFTLTFISTNKLDLDKANEYDGLIIGGGDVINDYFNARIRPVLTRYHKPAIAFSVGIPFPSLIIEEYLGYYQHVFLRNQEDVREVQKVVGSHRAHYIPDITLSFPYQPQPIAEQERKSCGLFLVGNLVRFPKIVEELARLIIRLSQTYQVTLYSFHPAEDFSLNFQLQDLIRKRYDGYEVHIDCCSYNAAEMIKIIGKLDLAVCMRYHAHLFAIIAGVNFLSISTSRKTRSLMKQVGAEEFQYCIELDDFGTPLKIKFSELKRVLKQCTTKSHELKDKTVKFLVRSRFLLQDRQANAIMLTATDENAIASFVTATHDYQNGARWISKEVLNYPDSGFNWGIAEKLRQGPVAEQVQFSLNYLTKVGTRFEPVAPAGNGILPLFVDLPEYQNYKDVHRGGWYLACEELASRNSVDKQGFPNGIICDMYLDRTFHWAKNYFKYRGVIPYTSPWMGFIHHTDNTSYSVYNMEKLFQDEDFLRSLHMCLYLFTLSESMNQIVATKVAALAPHVKVIYLAHPVDVPECLFSMTAFRENSHKMLINVGAWLRNPLAIYQAPLDSLTDQYQNPTLPFQKALLLGKDMEGYLPPVNLNITNQAVLPTEEISGLEFQPVTPCRDSLKSTTRWVSTLIKNLQDEGVTVLAYHNGQLQVTGADASQLNQQVQKMIASVQVIPFLDNSSYDLILSRNLVFLNLVDAGAVNTIIECIVRKTPIVVNRIPGTIALLGEKYPLFYNKLHEIPSLLTSRTIDKAHRYLSSLDVRKYQLKSFLKKISAIFPCRA